MFKQHEKSFATFQRLTDALFAVIFWVTAYWVRFEYLPEGQAGLEILFLKLSPVIAIATVYAFYKNGLYRSQRFASRHLEILAVVKANTMAIIALVMFLYFFGEERLSRLAILIYYGISTIGFIILRITIRNFLRSLRRKGKNLRHILLVGNGKPLVDYVHTARHFKDSGIRFMGWIDSHGLHENLDVSSIDKPYDELKKDQLPDSIIVSYEGSQAHKSIEFIQAHYNDVVPIQLLPDLTYSMIGHQVEEFGGIPLLSVNQPNLNPVEIFFKRVFDFIVTLIGLLIISPLMFLIMLGVKLSSPGPIFYGQERMGTDGKLFKMWKFRSMKVASDDTDKKEWSNKDNPRKTKFGSFIRSTSLDELPQLWNVLVGDMSLVGPRPEQPFFVEKFRHEIPGYMLKHKMKAGITGWAQVNGWRGDTSLEKRIECDLYYIKNWSLWLDIKILFLTFWKGFINKNAY